MATPAQRTNTWTLDQWYDQSVAGTTGGYVATEPLSLYSFGYNNFGELGLNNKTGVPAYTQLPGVWMAVQEGGQGTSSGVKDTGALYNWGQGSYGALGNNKSNADALNGYSSPKQLGTATDWNQSAASRENMGATKTTGELWIWGQNSYGQLGQNNRTQRSSPVQIPGTTWSTII